MVTGLENARQGLVKILDFGLAKLKEPEDADASAPTRPPPTEQGTILGTVGYMSPEQVEGRLVDARSDIFSFGSVLYEMVTGRRAFEGGSSFSTLSAILHQQPKAVTEIEPGTPSELERIISRCLRKDRDRRIQHMDDVKLSLEDLQEELLSAKPREDPTRFLRDPSRWPVVRLVVLASAIALAVAFITNVGSDAPSAYRFTPLAAEVAAETYPVWSPDSRTIAYVAEVRGVRQVFTRSLGSVAPTQVTSAPSDCTTAFWSPDGGRVYYVSQGGLWSVGAAGGTPQPVVKAVQAATITPDGKTLAMTRGAGGNMTLWIATPPEGDPRQYKVSPFPESFTRGRTLQFSPDASKLAVLMERDVEAVELWIVPYPSGAPRRVLGFQPMGTTVGLVDHRLSWTADSRHLVLDGPLSDRASNHLYLVDTESETLQPITPGTGEEWTPAVSPSGDAIAFAAGATDFDLVQVALDGSDVRPLLASSRVEMAPTWSPSGGQLAYITDAAGAHEIWLRSVQESQSRPIVQWESEPSSSWRRLERPSFSPDGSRIAYGVIGRRGHVLVIAPSAGGQAVLLDRDSSDHHGASWSPDGNWLAYTRLMGKEWQVVKAPLSGGQAVRLAEAAAGGSDTAWSPTGEWIAFARSGTLHAVSADGTTQKTFGRTVGSVGLRPGTFGFSKDGSLLYAVRFTGNQQWELVTMEVESGRERRVSVLNLPTSATIVGFSLHPDGKSFATSVGIAKFDIWLLEGFRVPGRWWNRLVPSR
jgi:Tol biopolymer transport system component